MTIELATHFVFSLVYTVLCQTFREVKTKITSLLIYLYRKTIKSYVYIQGNHNITSTFNIRTNIYNIVTNMDTEQTTDPPKNLEDGKTKLRKWLNTNFRIEMTDGRILIGVFLCTDRDANVILGACSEYLKGSEMDSEEPRVLGLVMVPGRHIVSIQIDDTTPPQKFFYDES